MQVFNPLSSTESPPIAFWLPHPLFWSHLRSAYPFFSDLLFSPRQFIFFPHQFTEIDLCKEHNSSLTANFRQNLSPLIAFDFSAAQDTGNPFPLSGSIIFSRLPNLMPSFSALWLFLCAGWYCQAPW